jgi:hypothetical protein
MKIANTRLKKTILIVSGSVIVFITVVILIISPVAKYVVEKYVGKYLGRQITMSWIYVNPFTGYVHISDLKIYESKDLPGNKSGDSIFLSVKGVSANFALRKLLSKMIEITEINLDHPRGIIIQNGLELNFSDLIRKFTPVPDSLQLPVPIEKRPTSRPFHFTVLTIKIEGGEFIYREELTPVNYSIREVYLKSNGKQWNADTMWVKFSFLSGPEKGSAEGDVTVNFNTLDYRLTTDIDNYDLKFMEQYLKELVNYGKFRATLDADVNATGNFKVQESLNAKGFVSLSDFHFGKDTADDYAAWEKLTLKITRLNPLNHQYIFDSVSLAHPYFKYERYDSLDNLQRMFGKNGSTITDANSNPAQFNLIIEIAHYVKVLATNFFQSDYKINRLAIYNADFKYNDFAIREKFSAGLYPLSFIADSINKSNKRVNALLTSQILPYGNIAVNLSINPNNKGDFDLHYHLQKVPASMFNPYLVSITSFPLDRGTLELTGTWNVRNDQIQSTNHLLLIDPRVTKRTKNKDTKWIPMPLIMSFIRESGNVIDYQIPITGSLKNPKFHLHDVLVDVIENIFVKPAKTNYRMEVKNAENEIENSLTLKWKARQSSLLPDQEKFVKTIVEFLVKNPDASIAIYPMQYEDKEKESINFFEAKKKYFLSNQDIKTRLISKDDSFKVDNMSVKDPSFVHYLNKHNSNVMLFTIQEKCSKYVGAAFVDTKFRQLNKDRADAFLSPFRVKTLQTRVTMHTGQNETPYNGYSFYKIVYKGEIPDALLKAYQKMNELNGEAPRKKFEEERKKNKSVYSEMK